MTSPRSARSRLEIAFKVVVLPAPLAPSSATIPPFGTLSDTPFSTSAMRVVDDLDVVDVEDGRRASWELRRHAGPLPKRERERPFSRLREKVARSAG